MCTHMELQQRFKTWLSRIKTYQDQRENQELIQPAPSPVLSKCVLEYFCQCWLVWQLCCTITVHILSVGFGPQMSIFPGCCCSTKYFVWACRRASYRFVYETSNHFAILSYNYFTLIILLVVGLLGSVRCLIHTLGNNVKNGQYFPLYPQLYKVVLDTYKHIGLRYPHFCGWECIRWVCDTLQPMAEYHMKCLN